MISGMFFLTIYFISKVKTQNKENKEKTNKEKNREKNKLRILSVFKLQYKIIKNIKK